MRFKELLRTIEQTPTPAVIRGRRRPGRNDQVSPHLIPLLRNPGTVDSPDLLLGDVEALPLSDDLMPIRGVMFSLALSVPLWTVIAGVIWVMLR